MHYFFLKRCDSKSSVTLSYKWNLRPQALHFHFRKLHFLLWLLNGSRIIEAETIVPSFLFLVKSTRVIHLIYWPLHVHSFCFHRKIITFWSGPKSTRCLERISSGLSLGSLGLLFGFQPDPRVQQVSLLMRRDENLPNQTSRRRIRRKFRQF